MTDHDRVRRERALACDRTSLESVSDAIRGLQSTDDPSLCPLHDELMKVYQRLLVDKAGGPPKVVGDDYPHQVTLFGGPFAGVRVADLDWDRARVAAKGDRARPVIVVPRGNIYSLYEYNEATGRWEWAWTMSSCHYKAWEDKLHVELGNSFDALVNKRLV